jgi:polyphosphate glucokinase
MNTLAIDIGGTGIKATILDATGWAITKRLRQHTPRPAPPQRVIEIIATLSQKLGDFDRVSVGFPGVVRSGQVLTAHLDPAWIGFQFDTALCEKFGKPVRVANDADVQGLGTIRGDGVELMITLGTGFGSSLFVDGKLVPNLQLAHQPFRNEKTYEQYLGNAAFLERGQKKWNEDLALALKNLEAMFQFKFAYIGGGNAVQVTLVLPSHIEVTPNVNGLLGGIALWRD